MFDNFRAKRALLKFRNRGDELAYAYADLKSRKNVLLGDVAQGHKGAYNELYDKIQSQISIVNESLGFLSGVTSGKKQTNLTRCLDRLSVSFKDLKNVLVAQQLTVKNHDSVKDTVADLKLQFFKEAKALVKIREALYRDVDGMQKFVDEAIKDREEAFFAFLQFAAFFMIYSLVTEKPADSYWKYIWRVSLQAGLATAWLQAMSYHRRYYANRWKR